MPRRDPLTIHPERGGEGAEAIECVEEDQGRRHEAHPLKRHTRLNPSSLSDTIPRVSHIDHREVPLYTPHPRFPRSAPLEGF